VRKEIEVALAQANLAVVPVLHDGAEAPREAELPEPLRPLARRQAVQLTGRELDRWITDLEASICEGQVRQWRGAQSLGAR
jgi:hypothetical protein